ncbi:hypothetical protein N0V86_007961 [Didymella sp. IMI 355093]|nr:hypothetical protein N0V86_007961 [Didymella sp. IMI 355093]
MTFTILSDNDVKSILSSLTKEDVSKVADDFIQSLFQYSCHNESQYQPERAVVKRDDQSSLFMPATTPAHIGVKIVGISPAKAPPPGEKPKPGLQATLTICDAEGKAVAAWLISEEARRKTRYIAAIGSYRLDMQEIDHELLKNVANPESAFKQQVWRGKVAVDSAEGCFAEAGELHRANIGKDGMLEVGKIQELRQEGKPEGLESWLETGFVIYKSVGVGIMDIAIGSKLLELAEEKGRGVRLNEF